MIVDALFGILVALTHFAILRGLSALLVLPIAALVLWIGKRKGKQAEVWGKGGRFVVFSTATIQFAFAGTGAALFWWATAWVPWMTFWASPTPALIFILYTVFASPFIHARIPLLRQEISFYRLSTLLVVSLILIQHYAPVMVGTNEFGYGLFASYCLIIFATF